MERTPKYYFRIRYIFVNTYPPKGLLKSFLLFIAQPWGWCQSKTFLNKNICFYQNQHCIVIRIAFFIYIGLVELPPYASMASRGLHFCLYMICMKWRLFYHWKASRSNISYIFWEVEAKTWLYFPMLIVTMMTFSWILWMILMFFLRLLADVNINILTFVNIFYVPS